MSANDRLAYQRLLAAYHRRQQILVKCEKILKLCEQMSTNDGALDLPEENIDSVIDDNFAQSFDDFDMYHDEEDNDFDPHYFNRLRLDEDKPLELSSLSLLDACQAFSNSRLRQDITCRPYLGLKARSLVSDSIEAPVFLQTGDVIHVPFSPWEMRLLIDSANDNNGIPDCREIAKMLRGRTVSDVRHAWIDHVLKIDQLQFILQVHDEPVPDRRVATTSAIKVLQKRSPLMIREAVQNGQQRARIAHWISRQGYIHAECTFRMQLDNALNEIVTGPTSDTSHLAVIVGSGNTGEGGGSPFVLDLTDKSTHPLDGHSGVVSEASFSADGRYIVTGSDDKSICIYDSGSFQRSHIQRTPNAVIRICHHKAAPVFAVASSNANSIMTVNAESLISHSARLPFEDTVLDFAFGALGTSVQNHLVVGFQNQTSLFKYQLTSTGLRRVTQLPDDNKVFLVRSVPTIAAAYASCFFYSTEGDDQLGSDIIKIWDARDPNIKTVTIRSHTKRGRHMIGDMSVSPDGRYLQTSGTDSCVCISDLRRLGSKPLTVLKHRCDIGQPTDGVATEWSRDSRFLVTGADDCTVRIWDMYTDDYEAENAGLIRVIDGNAGGEGCIHIVASINDSNGFIYGTKLGSAVAFEQHRRPSR